jgi:UDP-N-acetylglucosamine--N-acetylmuramyl-(pentapeptide) pyrophosphoryl-undecaprenol N-acetylglucosamine transferase
VRYLITGGGTGGHIYPALACAKSLEKLDPGCEVLYVGTRRGLEADLVPREGITFRAIEASGIMGKSPIDAARGAIRASKGLLEACRIVREFGPDACLGTGGYVSGPVIFAACLRRVPCAIQDQNAVPGFTNRILSRLVSEVYVPFEEARAHFPPGVRCVVTGNPVRPSILDVTREEGAGRLGIDPSKRTLLVFGGSRGARRIVEVALEMIEKDLLQEDFQVILITGREYESMARERLGRLGITPSGAGNLVIRPYMFDIENAMAASDVMIGRAGGMTVSELLARGLPSVLVPSPNVAGNHQMYNARSAARSGGAVVIKESDLEAKKLAERLNALLGDRQRLEAMSAKAREAGRRNAADHIARRLSSLAKRKKTG